MKKENDEVSIEGNPWKRIGEVLSIVVAAGTIAGLLYPIGLIALGVQLSATYAHDFATAWYAVSQVSKTVAMGRAARLLLGEAPFFLLYSAVVYKLVSAAYNHPSSLLRASRTESAKSIGSNRQKYIFRYSVPAVLILSIPPLTISAWDAPNWQFVLFRAASLVGAGISGVATASIAAGVFLRNVSFLRRFLIILAITYFALTLIAIFDAGLHEPSLPFVELNDPEDKTTKLQGRLLSHADGYWHMLVEPSGNILAIPDSDTGIVTIAPWSTRTTTPPR